MPEPLFQIGPARSSLDLDAAGGLFDAYAASLGIDLSFQDFAAERATLPGRYAPPSGALLLARNLQGEPVGCVGLRAIEPEGCCEMKRLYVPPAGRGLGVGRALTNAIIAEAERIGYREMRLDTLHTMLPAVALYRAAGFVPIPAYYETPIAGTIFLGKRLAD